MEYDIVVESEHADRMLKWVEGGVAVWRARDISGPGTTFFTPLFTGGRLTPRPSWMVDEIPDLVIYDPAKIAVASLKEVKRFHVAIRMGDQGLKMKLTDGATRRVQRELAKRPGAVYRFDYGAQDCVIFERECIVSLKDWSEHKQIAIP